MPRVYERKYEDFTESVPQMRRGKSPPYTMTSYVDVKCPWCNLTIEITEEHLRSSKASRCLKHIRECPAYTGEVAEAPAKKRKATASRAAHEGLVTIYNIIYIPEGRAVYTGRTKDPERRLAQHASASSKCRLIRNAMRRNGRKSYTIEPIMWCRPEDADANESFWIIENQTMHPRGYNLRHGATAGEEAGNGAALMQTSTNVVSFRGVRDEAAAMQDAWGDVVDFLESDEAGSQADDQLRDLLREVHPDRAEGRVYSANEVSAMLNSVREAL